MPNWVTNIVRCEEESMEKIKRYYCTKDGDFTFNKVIPMPDWLCGEMCMGVVDGIRPTERPESSYTWCLRNWDVKWDADRTDFQKDEAGEYLTFRTPWNMPDNVFRELSAQLSCAITVEYADEDMGSNCGRRVYDGHTLVTDEYLDGDLDFVSRVRGYKDFRDYLDDGSSPDAVEEGLKWAEEYKGDWEAKRADYERMKSGMCPYCGMRHS